MSKRSAGRVVTDGFDRLGDFCPLCPLCPSAEGGHVERGLTRNQGVIRVILGWISQSETKESDWEYVQLDKRISLRSMR